MQTHDGASYLCCLQRGVHPRCPLCAVYFTHPHELEQHIDRAHPGVLTDRSMCKFCGATFACRQNLRRHEARKHGGPKIYPCPDATCGKKYSLKEDLFYHIRRSGHYPPGFEQAGGAQRVAETCEASQKPGPEPMAEMHVPLAQGHSSASQGCQYVTEMDNV